MFSHLFLCLLLITCSQSQDGEEQHSASRSVLDFLHEFDREYEALNNEAMLASWMYETNISGFSKNGTVEANLKLSKYLSWASEMVNTFNLSDISDEQILRQIKLMEQRSLPDDEELELNSILAEMGSIYASSKVCPDDSSQGYTECYGLEPQLTAIMADSVNFTERTYYWTSWRNIVGRKLKPLYHRYVELKNKLAVLNGYQDYGHEWRSRYETDNLEEDVMALYRQIEPLYKQLHAYIRRKLFDVYGEEVIDLKGALPASVLSDMWGRFWNNLYKHVLPYPGKPSLDASKEMKKQNYTVLKMFQTGDDFYHSLGLMRVPDSFWTKSMFQKPSDREAFCHPTAWDFFDKEDFRIRMCANDNSFEDLNIIYHELGHIQYFMQYKSLPVVFRDAANDGFHEAVGELMAMCGATPKHLFKLNLTSQLIEDHEQSINFLMSQALITISTLPFHLLNDVWRWRIFRNDVKPEEWNDEFWRLSHQLVGVVPPVQRSEQDLDPPTIFHVCNDFDMIRYFVRTILQFQFAEKLCEISGHTGDLHLCDFSGSQQAGEALAKMLRLGKSLKWQKALKQLTGTEEMSAAAIRKFFGPLEAWLQTKNAENGDEAGWDQRDPVTMEADPTASFIN